MKPYTSGIGRELKEALLASSSHVFQRKCYELLQLSFPNIVYTRDTRELDQKGIDLYETYSEGTGLKAVFQCKGFEVVAPTTASITDCIKSISSFRKSGIVTNTYFLIVNRFMKGDQRAVILSALDELALNGAAQSAVLWDVNDMICFVFGEVRKQLESSLERSNTCLREVYKSRMEVEFYETDIPFKYLGKDWINAVNWFENTIIPVMFEPTNRRSWILVVSEFGFGKTSLVNELAERLRSKGVLPLSVPFSQLSRRAFGNEHEFISGLMSIVDSAIDTESASSKLEYEVRHSQWRALLKHDKRIILLLDGLDEHPTAYQNEGLTRIFSCLKTFNVTCLFGVRREFYEERAGSLTFGLGVTFRPPLHEIQLSEWPDSLITSFCETCAKFISDGESRKALYQFNLLVQSGRYKELYGDIPKRPLFLKMLLKDVMTGSMQLTNLAELYKKYILSKFEIDRAGWQERPLEMRPLTVNGDAYYISGLLFRILEQVARRMTEIQSNGEAVLLPFLDSEVLAGIAERITGQRIPVIELLCHSVLVPFDKRNIETFRVKFSHRSFQEYFLARYLVSVVNGSIEMTNDDQNILRNISPTIIRFVGQIRQSGLKNVRSGVDY